MSLTKRLNNKSIAWLAFFRVSVALFCLLHFLSLLVDIDSFLGLHALVKQDILAANRLNHFIPTVYDISSLCVGLFDQHEVNIIFSVFYIASLIFLAGGLFTRFSAIVSCLLHLILMNSLNLFLYGVDYFCAIALFYCILFPIGKVLSLDAFLSDKYWFFKRQRFNEHIVAISLFLLQVNICIAYFFGGLEKLIGFNWRNGESIWKAIHLYGNPDWINVNFLYNTPVFLIAGWGVIIIEMLYPIFINIRGIRKLWLSFIIFMHLSIALFLGLFFFSTFMIILNLSAYYIPYMKMDAKVKLTSLKTLKIKNSR